MHVAVLDLFGRRFADIGDIHVEMQYLARQRVVGVNGNVFVVYRFYNHQLYLAASTLCLKLHANFDLLNALESIAGNRLNQLGVQFAVGFSRLNSHFQRIARRFAFQLALQSGDNATVTVQVCKRLTAF